MRSLTDLAFLILFYFTPNPENKIKEKQENDPANNGRYAMHAVNLPLRSYLQNKRKDHKIFPVKLELLLDHLSIMLHICKYAGALFFVQS
jgi:hypothetical protein